MSEMSDIKRLERLEKDLKKDGEGLDPSGEEQVFDDYEETHIEPELRKDIEAVLNILVRPKLSEDGGDIEVSYLDDESVLWVRMLGGCSGCPSADQTAKGLVEKEIVARIPSIKAVEIDDGLDYDFIQNALDTMLSYRK